MQITPHRPAILHPSIFPADGAMQAHIDVKGGGYLESTHAGNLDGTIFTVENNQLTIPQAMGGGGVTWLRGVWLTSVTPRYNGFDADWVVGSPMPVSQNLLASVQTDVNDWTYGTGALVNITATSGAVTAVAVNTAGQGYAVGNMIPVNGGSNNCVLQVTSVSGSGGIAGLNILQAGSGYSTTAGATTMPAINLPTSTVVTLCASVANGTQVQAYYSYRSGRTVKGDPLGGWPNLHTCYSMQDYGSANDGDNYMAGALWYASKVFNNPVYAKVANRILQAQVNKGLNIGSILTFDVPWTSEQGIGGIYQYNGGGCTWAWEVAQTPSGNYGLNVQANMPAATASPYPSGGWGTWPSWPVTPASPFLNYQFDFWGDGSGNQLQLSTNIYNPSTSAGNFVYGYWCLPSQSGQLVHYTVNPQDFWNIGNIVYNADRTSTYKGVSSSDSLATLTNLAIQDTAPNGYAETMTSLMTVPATSTWANCYFGSTSSAFSSAGSTSLNIDLTSNVAQSITVTITDANANQWSDTVAIAAAAAMVNLPYSNFTETVVGGGAGYTSISYTTHDANSGGGASSITSSSFMVPAGALVVALWTASNSGLSPVITNTATALTWAVLASHVQASTDDVYAWQAVNTNAQSISVTVTPNASKTQFLRIIVITGQAATGYAISVTSGVSSAAAIADAVTPSKTGNALFGFLSDYNATSSFAAGNGSTVIDATYNSSGTMTVATVAPAVNPVTSVAAVPLDVAQSTGAITSYIFFQVVCVGTVAGIVHPIGQVSIKVGAIPCTLHVNNIVCTGSQSVVTLANTPGGYALLSGFQFSLVSYGNYNVYWKNCLINQTPTNPYPGVSRYSYGWNKVGNFYGTGSWQGPIAAGYQWSLGYALSNIAYPSGSTAYLPSGSQITLDGTPVINRIRQFMLDSQTAYAAQFPAQTPGPHMPMYGAWGWESVGAGGVVAGGSVPNSTYQNGILNQFYYDFGGNWYGYTYRALVSVAEDYFSTRNGTSQSILNTWMAWLAAKATWNSGSNQVTLPNTFNQDGTISSGRSVYAHACMVESCIYKYWVDGDATAAVWIPRILADLHYNFKITATGQILGAYVTNNGSGYTHASAAIVDSAGAGLTAAPYVAGGQVTHVLISGTQTANYAAPTIVITGDGAGASATCTASAMLYGAYNAEHTGWEVAEIGKVLGMLVNGRAAIGTVSHVYTPPAWVQQDFIDLIGFYTRNTGSQRPSIRQEDYLPIHEYTWSDFHWYCGIENPVNYSTGASDSRDTHTDGDLWTESFGPALFLAVDFAVFTGDNSWLLKMLDVVVCMTDNTLGI